MTTYSTHVALIINFYFEEGVVYLLVVSIKKADAPTGLTN